MFNMIHIRSYEVGLKFRDGEFVGLLSAGKHLVWTRLGKVRVRIVSKRDPWIVDEQLDVIVKSGKLAGKAEVIDLKDHQRALVWIDGRFGRYSRCDPSWRPEGLVKQGDESQEGGRSQLDFTPRRNRSDAQPSQYGKAADRQPKIDAFARAGSSRENRLRW